MIKHVIIKNMPEGDYLIECHRCGAALRPTLPIDINCFLSLANKFRGKHKNCLGAAKTEIKEIIDVDTEN